MARPDQRVEVRAVDVDLAAGVVHRGAESWIAGLEHAVRRRVGDHDRREPLGVLVDLGAQVGEVDVARVVAGDHDDPHAGHDGAGGVGAVRASSGSGRRRGARRRASGGSPGWPAARRTRPGSRRWAAR